MTKLIEAVKKNNLPLAKQLLSTEFCLPELINQGDGNNSWTALHHASAKGLVQAMRLLVDFGADIHLFTKKGDTAFSIAIENGHRQAAQILIGAGVDINQRDEENFTLLFWAAYSGDSKAVELLINLGADVNFPAPKDFSPLYIASSKGQNEIMKILMKAGANINLTCKKGSAPLSVAAQGGQNEAVQILIDADADVNIRTENRGITPLHMAAKGGHSEAALMLTNAGANTNQVDEDGATPLCMTVYNDYIETAQILINAGADVNLPENSGAAPLHKAILFGRSKIAHILIIAGADINQAIKNDTTPLQLAAKRGSELIVKMLLAYNTSVDCALGSALNIATRNKHTTIVDLIAQFNDNPLIIQQRWRQELGEQARKIKADIDAKIQEITQNVAQIQQTVRLKIVAKKSKRLPVSPVITAERRTPPAIITASPQTQNEHVVQLNEFLRTQFNQVNANFCHQINRAEEEAFLAKHKAKLLDGTFWLRLSQSQEKIVLSVIAGNQKTNVLIEFTQNNEILYQGGNYSIPDFFQMHGAMLVQPLSVAERTEIQSAHQPIPPNPTTGYVRATDGTLLPPPPTTTPIRRRSASPHHLRAPNARPENRASADNTSALRNPPSQQYQRATIPPPKIEEDTQLACAIESHRPTAALRPTNKAIAQQQLQQDYTAFTSQQTALASLEAEIARLKLAGVDVNTVRINELQAQHDVVAEQVGILFNQFMREQARIQAIEAFSSDPRLADFYSTLQNLLGNVVIGYKAAASGIMQIQSSEVGGHFESAADASTSDIAASALKSGAKKLGKVLGKNADKIISTASQGITLLGHSFEFLPGVGALLKGAGKMAGVVAEKRAMNRCIALSEQITMPIFLGASQQLAFQLTQQFKAQLLSLPLPSDERSSMTASVGQKLFKSGAQSSVRKLAEYATLLILESFHEHHVPENALSEEAWVQHWLAIVHKPRQPSTGPMQQCLNKLGVNSMTVVTQHKARWNLTQLFAETGLQVPGAVVLYYARSQSGAQLYGFRTGTQYEAKQYQMITVSGPHQSASTTQASSASVKHVAQQVSAARQQMGALELQAKQMRMQAKRNNGNRLANEIATLKMEHESLFQNNSVELQQQGTKLAFTFRQPNLREAFAESLSYLDLTTDCRLLTPSQVELSVKTTFLANKLKAQLLQQGMSENVTTAPAVQHNY